ncbi:hypothetical protein QJQ45_017511 [Haematococcus lacustris]|nr:hypothetical protein QJQ45_017511 [Haematococcus lacustris]
MSGLWEWAASKVDAAEKWLVDEILVGWNPSRIPSLYGKVAVVTGANSGIGYETTRKLAENGAEVYMVVRNMDKGRAAVEQLRKELGPVKLHLLQADFESMREVLGVAAELKGVRIDLLISIIGTFFPGPFKMASAQEQWLAAGLTTEDGLEQTLATNFFSGALLALSLVDQMKSPGSRIIFMASQAEWPLSKVEPTFHNIRCSTAPHEEVAGVLMVGLRSKVSLPHRTEQHKYSWAVSWGAKLWKEHIGSSPAGPSPAKSLAQACLLAAFLRGNELKRSGLTAYGSSKAYEIMFARELASRLKHRGIDVFAVQPGVVWTPVHAKMDRSHYLAAWAVSGSGLFFGQTQYHGAWSTLYAATEPSLSGKGFGYFGPNMLGLWPPRKSPQAPCSSQAATQPAASEPRPSTPPPAKHSKRTKAEQAAEAQGKVAKAKPAPQLGRCLDRVCNAALNMHRIGESKWCPLELCYWPEPGKLPAKGKEYSGLGYKRLRDKPPKTQPALEEEAAIVSKQRWGTGQQLVVFFGNASGTRGGWGANAVLLACRKVVKRPYNVASSSPAAENPSDSSSSSNTRTPSDIGSGLADERAFLFDPATQMGMGLDPGAIQAVSAASGVWRADGLLQGFYRSKLTRSQVQHDSGLIQARRNTQRWNDNIKLELQHLASATPAGTSLVAIQQHVAVTLATWDAVWGEYPDPKWAEHRMRLHGAQETVLERYFMKLEEEAASVSQQEWGTRKQLVVFFGNAGIGTRGGWGAKAVLQACRKVVERANSGKPIDRVPGKVVTVDEFRTSRVSSILNSPQPCEEELDSSKPTRPEGWKPKPGQVQDRLLRSAWSKRFEAPVRGLMWCPWLAHAIPGNLGKWVDRDCNAALNLQRAGESKWRPLELCRWPHRGRLPAQGKEYPALGFKKLRERAPKAQAQQPTRARRSVSEQPTQFFAMLDAAISWVARKLHDAEQWLVDEILVGWNPASVPNLYGKVAVITGANSGIGYETTRKLAENGAEVYMVVRNMDKGRAAVEQLRKELGPVKLHLLQADMESMSQVQSLLAELRGVRPDILLHNAGILYPGPFRLTEEGLEPTLAISYYSGVLLALGLLDQMKPRSRVIFMASAGEWPMSRLEGSFSNMRGDKFTASGARAYGQAKAFAIMFARELAERVKHRGIDVFAVQPGKGSGYFGPNLLNMWHATERQPGTKQARNPYWCWR